MQRQKQSRTSVSLVSCVRGKASGTLTLLSCAVILLSGCKENGSEKASFSEPVYSKQYRQGSAIVIVSLSETNIPTAGKIQLTLDIHAPENSEIWLPEIDEYIDPFTVADHYAEPIQTLPSGKQLHRQAWTLLPKLPGSYSFQPLEISIGSTRVKTAPVKIGVSSLLPADVEGFEIKDIAEPIALLPEEAKKREWIFDMVAGLVGFMLVVLAHKYRKRKKQVPVRLPREMAFQALEQLPQNELERIQALTEILLTYLEGRLHVPTTGKTLREIFPNLPKKLLLGRREPLETILTTSEQVRFSHKIPFGFSVELQEYVRTFIERMEEEQCD